MKSRYFRFAVLLVAMALVNGCATLEQPFGPAQSFDTNADIQALEVKYGTASSITGYYAGTQNETTRNEFISGRLAVINLQYILFIRQFSADKAQLETAFDLMQLGVDLAITVVGGESIKAALGAASTGITGTRISINKNFFFEQTVPALITAMNAARKEALIPILRGIDADLTAYPFAAAVSDLEAYYFAGTFVGGLQAIQKDAGAKEAAADLRIDDFREAKFRPLADTGAKIKAWYRPGGVLDTEKRDRLVTWLAKERTGINPAGLPLTSLLRQPQLEAARAQVIIDLRIP